MKKFVANPAFTAVFSPTGKNKSHLLRWLGWIVAALLLGLLGYQTIDNLRRLGNAWALLPAGAGGYIWLAAALVPLNWHLEVTKWRSLAHAQLQWPLARYYRAVLMGLTAGILTPNRLGDYGGRLLGVPRRDWPTVLVTTFLGGLAQWAAFLLLGWPGLVYVAADYLPLGNGYWLLSLGPLALFAGTAYLVARTDRLITWLPQRWRHHTGGLKQTLQHVKFVIMLRAGIWACLRFGVYSTQLYLLLLAFGLELPLLTGLAGIAAIYLLQAGLPLPPGIGLATRAELGVLLWGHTPAAGTAVVFATTLLFVLNLLLPSLLGWRHIVKTNEKTYVENVEKIS